ncbi:MAG: nuclear transport factor 2 family protein [Actinomycetota bacterium]
MSIDLHPFLERLLQATNAHDLDALVDCFNGDYRNETPTHPARSFAGPEQVRKNWQQIFGYVPDVSARVVGRAVDGTELWSEWEMSGTRLDGTPHLMRGVIIFGLRDGRASSARFYLEPVDAAATTVDEAVSHQVHAGGRP